MPGGTPIVSRVTSEKRNDPAFRDEKTGMVKLDKNVRKLIAASKDGAGESLSLINLTNQRLYKIEKAQDLVIDLIRPT